MTVPRRLIPDMPTADELLPYLRRIDDNRWYTNFGALAAEFEQRLIAHLTARETAQDSGPICLATVASGHQALVVALHTLNLKPAARVLVPCITFPSSALAVEEAGLTPVFSDIDPESWSLTPAIAREIAAHHTIDAVMPVAIYGVPNHGWDEFTAETGIPAVIDAAAALDAQPVPVRNLVVYSLHATKPFAVGEGGILAGRDTNRIDAARQIMNFGMQNQLTRRFGTNAKLSEYHAAVGLAQLDRWQGVKDRRHAVLERYRHELETVGLLDRLQKNISEAVVSSLMINHAAADAEERMQALHLRGIGAHRSYWPPLPDHPHFAGAACIGDLPHARRLNKHIIGLPFHGAMKDDEIRTAVEAVA